MRRFFAAAGLALGFTLGGFVVPPPATAQAKVTLDALFKTKRFQAVRATVPNDIVYKRRVQYEGYRLRDVVKAAFPNFAARAKAGDLLVMRAADGYAPSMPLSLALSRSGVIAFRDLAQPANKPFADIQQGKKTKNPGKYYLVWTDIDPKDSRFKWPYQLVELELKGYSAEYGAALPRNTGAGRARALRGFGLFKEHCIQCHSVNLVGGKVGPELNVPVSVTEYWKPDYLPRFIRKVSSIRAKSAMPDMEYLKPANVADILFYLRVKAREKVCGGAKAC